MTSADQKFVDSIYEEYEQKLFKAYGFGLDGLRVVLDRPPTASRAGNSIQANFDKALLDDGAVGLRREMYATICSLEFAYLSDGLGREATFNEWIERLEELDIGLNKKLVKMWFEK